MTPPPTIAELQAEVAELRERVAALEEALGWQNEPEPDVEGT